MGRHRPAGVQCASGIVHYGFLRVVCAMCFNHCHHRSGDKILAMATFFFCLYDVVSLRWSFGNLPNWLAVSLKLFGILAVDVQQLIVLAIVLLAASHLIWRMVRFFSRGHRSKEGGCSTCSSCHESTPRRVWQIQSGTNKSLDQS